MSDDYMLQTYKEASAGGAKPDVVISTYELWCFLRGETPDPELLGWTVITTKSSSRLVTFNEDGDLIEHPSNPGF